MDDSPAPGEPLSTGEPPQEVGPRSGEPGEEARGEGALPQRPLDELEEKIGYRFADRQRLVNALVHKSYLHAVPDFPPGSNERL
ncbi:MAG TPA: hypothetical protein VEY08_09165, partial [Chloroflexia bacterium]|nr:hypothetical protein [Chloroflexia bacterium]